MASQLRFEDIEVGSEIPQLIKRPTIVQLVKYAGAVGDWSPYNFDREYARSIGLPDVLVTGSLLLGFLAQTVTDWMGEHATLRKLSCSHRAVFHPDVDIICKGKVTNKYVEGGEAFVECEVWIENEEGQKLTPGTAVVVLPHEGLNREG